MLPGQNSRDRIRRYRGGGIIWHTVSNFCRCSLLADPLCFQAGAGEAELAHANLLSAPSPPQFPRESKAQRAAWIHSKDCEPLNSLSAQLQQTSFKQSSAVVGMENLAVNRAKSSYLSPSERHQPRKQSSFSLYSNTFLMYICHHSSPCVPVQAQKGNRFVERRGQRICIQKKSW